MIVVGKKPESSLLIQTREVPVEPHQTARFVGEYREMDVAVVKVYSSADKISTTAIFRIRMS